MATFTQHTIESAPEASRPDLEAAKKAFGTVPNLFTVMAESPVLLQSYNAIAQLLEQSSLSPPERQIVLLAVSFENNCNYCVAAHSLIGKGAGLTDEQVTALRDGTPLPDVKHEALRTFAVQMVTNRGWVADEDVQAFLDAGYTKQHILDVIAAVALKTMSNFTNHLADTPLDGFLQGTKWEKPVGR